ncbi:hypothetical protein IV203_021233 [Nitzschia inconspicua]|uniref:Uncharacterized protein n=1 Tax=Nitzschia inconspicua TaxID=303405 RepID=A0A9K3PD93_9STRA|nr:hypothetical protein IV203_021233 [Nitzschia inconspicua]
MPPSSTFTLPRNMPPSSLSFGRHRSPPVTSTNCKQTPDVMLLDVTDMKWKLYDKNERFTIVQDAVVKIQAFVRGSMSRARTSEMIQELIDGILSYREVVAKYSAEDEARVKKQQLGLEKRGKEEDGGLEFQGTELSSAESSRKSSVSVENKPWLRQYNSYTPSGTPLEVDLKERLSVLDTEGGISSGKVWARKKGVKNASSRSQDMHSTGEERNTPDNESNVSLVARNEFAQTMNFWESKSSPNKASGESRNVAEYEKQNTDTVHKGALEVNEVKDTEPMATFPEEYLQESVALEPGGRGYNRYRSTASGRNKRRPWRDDTNVFDAY